MKARKQDFTVRMFEGKDLNRVIYINGVCLPEHYSNYFYIDIHERFPETFLVAEKDGDVIGYIMCRVEAGLSSLKMLGLTRKGHIASIAVLPDHRDKGVGTALVEKALGNMQKNGARECYLEVRVSNEAAIQFYKRLGFNTTKTVRGYYADGEDAYVMSRKL